MVVSSFRSIESVHCRNDKQTQQQQQQFCPRPAYIPEITPR